ncbi:Scr1 family TA system antitoxin-like transcriptional regulator [Pseudonocardia sichuanensis]
MPRRSQEEVSRRGEMPRLLVAIRRGRRQVDFARTVGLTQSKVSRLEKGLGPPLDPQAAAAYAAAAAATPEQTARLVELAEISTNTHQMRRAVVLRNANVTQSRIRDYTAAAGYVWSWTPTAVPGELQTRAWTKAMLAGDDDGSDPGPDWWAPREARIALLDDSTHQWRFLLTEGGLRWIVGSRSVQAAVVEHIAEISTRDHIEVGVIDQTTPKQLIAPDTFHLYGDRAAEVDGTLGPAFVEDPDDLKSLRGIYEQLWAHAHLGDGARALLGRIARAVRR